MIVNYLKIAWRYLWKNQWLTLINLMSLAVGLTSCLLIGLYISHELAYDQHHVRQQEVYRLVADRNYTNGEQKKYATAPVPLAQLVQQELPEVVQTTQVFSPQWTTQKTLVASGPDRTFYESDLIFADSTFFQVLGGYAFIAGQPATALLRPSSVVLTERAAQKYFGNQDPLGQKLTLDGKYEVEVTGVLRDSYSPSHLEADIIASFDIVKEKYSDMLSLWGWDLTYTYLVVSPGSRPEVLSQKVAGLVSKHLPDFKEMRGYEYGFELQLLTDIHLYSDRQWEVQPNGKALYVKVLGVVAVLVLLVSCINSINLQLTRLSRRLVEMSVRKVLGAGRTQLPLQLLMEAALLTTIALVLTALFSWLALPWLERLTGESYSEALLISTEYNGLVVAGIGVIIVAVGLLPARFIARLNLAATLKNGLTTTRSLTWLHKGLLVGQFSVSVFLLIASLVLYRQLDHWQSQPLGFEKESVLIVKGYGSNEQLPVLKEAFRSIKGVGKVAAASGVPGSTIEKMRVIWEGQSEPRPVDMLWVDEDFVSTLGIGLAAGRDFSTRFGTDTTDAYLINETAARTLGWQQPLGKQVQVGGRFAPKGKVVGVIKDIHHASLHQTVEPLVMLVRPSGYSQLVVRVQGPVGTVITDLEKAWKRVVPNQPFEYDFLDQQLARQYRRELVFGEVVVVFTLLAVLIACMGLFGLSALMAEQRTKEIGVRKVLGASVAGIVALLSRDFLVLVLVAIAVASPLAWWAMDQWLQNFAYHITVEWWLLLVAGLVAIAVALLTIGLQGVKAALMNPVRTLRSE
ncbi:ABC transporter permease [Telluribacter sp. SYSU D00476]|uniref:ABC transporter permease n=1 Tax=Telluribacter sp. SYSU D00476 TaxID=2811430 RepID=UPI001FF59323|nr:ABC transporter permease [Telluribacter sp. SYSU D00476]